MSKAQNARYVFCPRHGWQPDACPYCGYSDSKQASPAQSTVPSRASRSRQQQLQPMAYLVLVQPTYLRGQFFPLKNGDTIGQASNNGLSLPDAGVSAQHCQIYLARYQGQTVFAVRDLASQSGTYLNRRRITRPALLRQDDELIIGRYRFVFKTLFET